MAEKKCTHCDNIKDKSSISFAVFESVMTREHKKHKALVFVIIMLILLLFASNAAWTIYDKQFEIIEESYDIQQDTEKGNNNYIVKGGEICNGEAKN